MKGYQFRMEELKENIDFIMIVNTMFMRWDMLWIGYICQVYILQ